MTTLFIGLGMMGDPMVKRYAPAHATVLYDVNHDTATALAHETGTQALDDISELSPDITTVIMMLPNSRIVESVVRGSTGLFARLPAGALIIDMGSSEPASTRALAQEAALVGLSYVDAPVSGGVSKATTGQLSIMVGGAPTDIERAMEHLQPLGTSITRVGPAGSGHAAKALNNLLSATNLAAAAEILTVAKNFGIAAEVMIEVINTSTGRSQASEIKYPNHVLNGTFDSGFSMDLMLKDLAIAHTLSVDAGLQTPVTDSTVTTLVEARRVLDAAHLDHTEVARYYELVNDVELRTSHGTPTQEETPNDD
ncbi:NAD(P)-dependent oxidoreductase [Cryobacterium sp. N19]|uniref:NAD(P)-dependent oxidoreductase n=1 Tax=Cryobacterium sp. N19 TaxID=2048288 RepID=UPI000CE43CE5|nr:NAD(P)-dependent oxidoreductase [Cryobacterium sp. N19]